MIKLQKFDIDKDISRLINWIDSPRLNIVWATDKFTFPLQDSELVDYFQSTNSNNTVVFKVREKETKAIIGHCELEVKPKSVKICRLLIAEKYRGNGYGKETIQELLKYTKNNLKVDTVLLTVFSFNPAIKLYKKMGFEKTKVEENYLQFENERWNRVTMELKK